ncbi:MAG TPA: TolC family protein [Polyangia bacterium]
MRGAGARVGVLLAVALLAPSLGRAQPPAVAQPAPSGVDAAEAGMVRATFDDAVRRALARNPNVIVATEEIRRVDAIVRQVRALSLPTLYGNVVYGRLDADRILGGGPTARVIAAADAVSINGIFTLPLVQTRGWVAWAHARENVGVTRLTAADVRRQVALATARAYLTVMAAKRVLEVMQRARVTAKAHYDYAHARRQGGVGNRIDEVRAAQELATDEAQVESAEANVVRAREALGVLLGVEQAVDTADEPALATAPSFAAALEDAERQRSDVRAARARLRLAENVYHDTWADFMPSLTVQFQPFYQNPASLTLPTTGWQATFALSVPFYDGGLRYGLRRERAALTVEARATLEGTVRQARADVRTAYEAARRAEAALVAAKQAAKLSRDALDLATLAYRAGATTNIEVIDAERRARDAGTTAAIAEDNAQQARIDLLASSGRFP